MISIVVASRDGELDFEVNSDIDHEIIVVKGFENVSKARNLGAKRAEGDILVFLDDDCLLSENYLSKVEKSMENYDAVRGKVTGKNIYSSLQDHYDLGDEEKRTDNLMEGNMAIKKWLFEDVGGFQEKIEFGHEGVFLSSKLEEIHYCPELEIYHEYADGMRSYIKKKIQLGRNYPARWDETNAGLDEIIPYLKPINIRDTWKQTVISSLGANIRILTVFLSYIRYKI